MEILIVVLIVLWLLGFFGARRGLRVPRTGNLIHILLVIALILIIVRVIR
jgi:Family of unknown function (DUF5670)